MFWDHKNGKRKFVTVSLTEVATDDEGQSVTVYESSAKFLFEKQRQ